MYGYAANSAAASPGDAVHRGAADHQPGRVGRAERRGHPGRRNRRRQRTGVAVGADLPDAAEPRNARRLLHDVRLWAVGAFIGNLENVLGLTGTSAASGSSADRHRSAWRIPLSPGVFRRVCGHRRALAHHGQCGDRCNHTRGRSWRRRGAADGAAGRCAEGGPVGWGAPVGPAEWRGRGSELVGTPESRPAWARRLRWGGCRCRRIGFGRRRLRRRCCFPRVCRCQRSDAEHGGGLGFPFAFGGLPGAAAAGAAAGAAGSKYGSRLKVVARPPAAGYPAEPAGLTAPRYPMPAAAYSTNGNGHAPPGYRPAIVYLPTNGNDPAHV